MLGFLGHVDTLLYTVMQLCFPLCLLEGVVSQFLLLHFLLLKPLQRFSVSFINCFFSNKSGSCVSLKG